MKKLLLIVLVFVFVLVVLTGCSGITPPPVEEPSAEILALIREYTGHDSIVRWADGDGIVNVYDGTTNSEWTEDILDEINIAIDGPVVFEFSKDYSNNQINIIFEDLTGTGLGQAGINIESSDEYIYNVDIKIDPLTGALQPIYMSLLLNATGIELGKAIIGLTQEMKKVLYWLYRLEPGYPLV